MSPGPAPSPSILLPPPSNVLVLGGQHYNIHGDYRNVRCESHPEGLRNLHQHISPSMLHDSRHRLYNFKCHPETLRTAAGRVQEWLRLGSPSGKKGSLFQLHGGSRAQKTAIAQAMADHYSESIPSPLLAAIFINDKDIHQIITTIAYQVALAVPETRSHIIRAMEEDPAIVDRRLKTQCKSLILEPLRRASTDATPSERLSWPNLVVLDGLHYCVRGMGHELQCILQQVLEFSTFPLAILITTVRKGTRVTVRRLRGSFAIQRRTRKTGVNRINSY